MFISGMHGLGDNIYQRAIIPRDIDVMIKTSWPEIYKDLPNVKCVRKKSPLRTQLKNEIITCQKYHREPVVRFKQISYQGKNIIQGMSDSISSTSLEMDLPDYGTRPIPEKYAIIRPVTIRREWQNISRNPLPEYIDRAALELKKAGYYVIMAADVDGKLEKYVGDKPYHDKLLSVPVSQLLRYTQHADVIVGGIGWIVPAAIAQKRNALIICGGQGALNNPDMLTDDRMDLTRITFIKPDNFCRCKDLKHDCDKTITNFTSTIRRWIDMV